MKIGKFLRVKVGTAGSFNQNKVNEKYNSKNTPNEIEK
jgi:surface antigen